MIGVLLSILKILGIIILIILGLILGSLLILLFVPVRYEIDGNYYDNIKGSLKVTWFFKIVNFRILYNKKIYYDLKIFAYHLFTNDEEFLNKKKEKINKKVIKKGKELAEKGLDVTDEIIDNAIDDIDILDKDDKEENLNNNINNIKEENLDKDVQILDVKKKDSNLNEEKKNNKAKFEDNKIKLEDSKKDNKNIFDYFWTILDKIVSLPFVLEIKLVEKLKNIYNRVIDGIIKFKNKIKKSYNNFNKIKDKIKILLEYITSDEMKHSKNSIIKYIKKIIKHIFPKKIKGKINFGFDNPANTGYILAILGMSTAIHKNKITIVPNFDEKVFNGEIYCKGRFQGYYILYIVICIFKDKILIRQIKDILNKLKN